MRADVVAGVTLAQFAGVTAAVAEEFPLEDVLAMEGITASRWGAAQSGWKGRVAGDPATLDAYRAHLAAAEDHLARRVARVDCNLEAWIALLGAFASGATSAETLGLRSSDLSRLARRWGHHLARDPDLAAYAARLAGGPKAPVPTLSVGPPPVLRPFPWTAGASPAGAPPPGPPPPAAPTDRPSSLIPPSRTANDFGLDAYAALCLEIAEAPEASGAAYALYGTSEAAFRAIDGYWRGRFAADESLHRAYRSLYGSQRAQRHALRRR